MLRGASNIGNAWKVVRPVQRDALGMFFCANEVFAVFVSLLWGVKGAISFSLVRISLNRYFFHQMARLERVKITSSAGSGMTISHRILY